MKPPIGKDFLDRIICALLGLIRADLPNPRSSAGYCASRWSADKRGCDGFSLIECASFYSRVWLQLRRPQRIGQFGRELLRFLILFGTFLLGRTHLGDCVGPRTGQHFMPAAGGSVRERPVCAKGVASVQPLLSGLKMRGLPAPLRQGRQSLSGLGETRTPARLLQV